MADIHTRQHPTRTSTVHSLFIRNLFEVL